MNLKVTLVSVPLDKARNFENQRISELDFLRSPPTGAEISEVSFVNISVPNSNGGNLIEFDFYQNWSRDAISNDLLRGPGMYMVRVESREKARDDDGLVDEQRVPSYTKEARLFFKVVNEFQVDSDATVLLVNNTDKDPYRQRYSSLELDEDANSGAASVAVGGPFQHSHSLL